MAFGAAVASLLVVVSAFWVPIYQLERDVVRLAGEPIEVVRAELGVPTKEWSSESFQCAPAWPCHGEPKGGAILLFSKWDRGWYLYFDRDGRLRTIEPTRS